jgi:hypothetical protein
MAEDRAMSETAHEPAIEIPQTLEAVRHVGSGSAHQAILIASTFGHSPAGEERVLAVLEHLDSQQPIDYLFVTFDAAHRKGNCYFDQRELDVSAFKAFPNRKVTADLAVAFQQRGWADATWAFSVMTQRRVRLRAFDDWYSWTL